jgi:hypothetical protein
MSTVEHLVWHVRRLPAAGVRVADRDVSRPDLLDRLLVASPDFKGHTPLAWWAAPAAPSARHLNRASSTKSYFSGAGLPLCRRNSINRLRDLARRGSHYSAQGLAKLRNPLRRYALLRAHLNDLGYALHDDIIDMFDRFMGDLYRQGERKQERTILHDAREIHWDLHTLADGMEAFLRAHPVSTV